MQSRARNQQIRTQMVMNEILMLASPLLQHQVAELHKQGAARTDSVRRARTGGHFELRTAVLSSLLTVPAVAQWKRRTRRSLRWGRSSCRSKCPIGR